MEMGHWSLRYFYNKLKNKFYQKIYPDHPWLTKQANFNLMTLLKPTDIGLEFGSGRSTIWFAKKIKHLTSVEHNKEWYDKIFRLLEENKVHNVEFIFEQKEEEYLSVVKGYNNNSLDFVLIDGILRGKCANAILDKVKDGGIIVIDDAHRYFDFPSVVPYSLYKKKEKPSKEWELFMNKIKNCKYIWTTSGISDTIILFKYHRMSIYPLTS